jgi:hypothetical protein
MELFQIKMALNSMLPEIQFLDSYDGFCRCNVRTSGIGSGALKVLAMDNMMKLPFQSVYDYE